MKIFLLAGKAGCGKDLLGSYIEIQIIGEHQKLEWVPIAVNREICKVYIPQ